MRRELTDIELSRALPVLVKSIGMTPHGSAEIHHFDGYVCPDSASQYIGEESHPGHIDSKSAHQWQIDPEIFHKKQVNQTLKESHLIINYLNNNSIWVSLESCRHFDVEAAMQSLKSGLMIDKITWHRFDDRPLI